jgi:hypothetical protein
MPISARRHHGTAAPQHDCITARLHHGINVP